MWNNIGMLCVMFASIRAKEAVIETWQKKNNEINEKSVLGQ